MAPPELTDLHTHLIPGVDDGAEDLAVALETLGRLYDDGVTAIAATPHLSASNPNGARRARADAAWPELVGRACEAVPGLDLYRGFEIALDTPDLDLQDGALRLAGSRFALVEFYAFTVPERSAEILAGIVAGGYVPIVAHPERYWGYDRGLGVVAEWRSAGALVQVNSGSLLGEYGAGPMTVARSLLKGGQVDLIGSDNHARLDRCPSLRQAWDYLVEAGLAEQARLLLSTNPRRILGDEMPISVGRAETRRGLVSRLARRLRGEG